MTHRGIPLKWLAGCSMLPVLRTINMEHIDLRKLNRGELTQVRRQVVRLKKMWKTGKEIEELTGVQQSRGVRDILLVKVDPHKFAHGIAVINCVLYSFIG